ncbi:hypothetical protein, unlikely [Trypanosoma brucei gambiense DAL972]|uniref:Uncharacterized protein n=1 Tax=Trypanosoma brucei gambiense (strain MHOM/CI/86/DAL972) TaxID=679716 RepID=C9ZW17_TRYB9|nr:hypothetical protein, unlikely [Trypanosoma brucei gambiense DAL972]CBH13606.1 hypothetical protein, unlikely [Trypanosoma brucei gambiense DAL972]|eukprot:XP_011775882.1 hypothetical protein, unlikely [Trypanosoma brucei gambiense DAL972]
MRNKVGLSWHVPTGNVLLEIFSATAVSSRGYISMRRHHAATRFPLAVTGTYNPEADGAVAIGCDFRRAITAPLMAITVWWWLVERCFYHSCIWLFSLLYRHLPVLLWVYL